MKLIVPITMTDAQLLASNVAETDFAAWDISTTYADGDRVISTTTHKVYESQQGSNLGYDPTDAANVAWWLEVSATNRWKAFDSRIADQVSNAGTITYSVAPVSKATGLAFFGLNAASVQVEVYNTDSPAVKIYDTTLELVDDSDIIDWFTFFTTSLDQFQTEALFANVPVFAGYQVDITVGDGSGTAKCGEIAIGNTVVLGETLEGTTIGLTSFSTKEQDSFGNWTVVSRAKSDPVEFQFAMSAGDAGRVKRVLNAVRDTPAVYFADESLTNFGAVVFGFFQDYEIPLRRNGFSVVQLEIEGLT